MIKFWNWINNCIHGILSKSLFQWVKEKGQFTLFFFYLKPNEEVQLDLQHFEICMFLSLLPDLPPGKMKEEKLTSKFSQFRICMAYDLVLLFLQKNVFHFALGSC